MEKQTDKEILEQKLAEASLHMNNLKLIIFYQDKLKELENGKTN